VVANAQATIYLDGEFFRKDERAVPALATPLSIVERAAKVPIRKRAAGFGERWTNSALEGSRQPARSSRALSPGTSEKARSASPSGMTNNRPTAAKTS